MEFFSGMRFSRKTAVLEFIVKVKKQGFTLSGAEGLLRSAVSDGI
jgi:hypothetical protein